MIAIIDYGMGNLASVSNALAFLEIEHSLVKSPKELLSAGAAILPGVGAYGQAMQNLHQQEMVPAIKQFALEQKKPFMGICLGMQLMLQSSTEHGHHEGLGLVPGKVLALKEAVQDQPVPHVGWNVVRPAEQFNTTTARLFTYGLSQEPSYYFVHSYYCHLEQPEMAAGRTVYGLHFDSALEHKNLFACQFHPEKSQQAGLNIFEHFAAL